MTMDNPARDTYVASYLDPAFDTSTPEGLAALDAYARTRALADLAKVPLVEHTRPVLWRVRALTAQERAIVVSNRTPPMADYDAVRYAVIERIEDAVVTPEGRVEGGRPTLLARDKASGLATAEALAAEMDVAGGAWIDEMGGVIRQRTDMHPRRLLPFRLPPRVADLR